MASLENILVDVILLFTHAESSSVRLEAYSNHAPLSVCLSQSVCLCPVSYTHLTLPTIYSV